MGVMAAGAVAGIGGSIASGIQASKMAKAQKKIAEGNVDMQKKLHEGAAADREKYSQMSLAHSDIARSNILATEQAQVQVMSMLGQPGTYGPNSTGGLQLGQLSPLGLGGIEGQGPLSNRITSSGKVKRKDYGLGGGREAGKFKKGRKWEVEGDALDADAMASAAMDSSAFRSVSGMVAEAEQLQNRTGPLWEQLNNSIVGSIYESSAAGQKDAMENMSRQMAKGGTARHLGLQMASQMQVQEQTNRTRTGQLWQAKAQLEEYRTQQVKSSTSFAQDWVRNASGIRDSFTANLNQMQMHWATTMAPHLASLSTQASMATQTEVGKAREGLMSALQTKNQGIQGMISGVTGAAQSVFGGIQEGKDLDATRDHETSIATINASRGGWP